MLAQNQRATRAARSAQASEPASTVAAKCRVAAEAHAEEPKAVPRRRKSRRARADHVTCSFAAFAHSRRNAGPPRSPGHPLPASLRAGEQQHEEHAESKPSASNARIDRARRPAGPSCTRGRGSRRGGGWAPRSAARAPRRVRAVAPMNFLISGKNVCAGLSTGRCARGARRSGATRGSWARSPRSR